MLGSCRGTGALRRRRLGHREGAMPISDIMDPKDLHHVNATIFVEVLLALLTAAMLVWFIISRTSKFEIWVKGKVMQDVKFIEAIGNEVGKRVVKAFEEHEAREEKRTAEFEARVERRMLQFTSHLQILEGKLGVVESKLDSKAPKNH